METDRDRPDSAHPDQVVVGRRRLGSDALMDTTVAHARRRP